MTPLIQMHPSQATMRLTQIVQQAYHRKSRQLPSNLSEIVDTFKGDLLKYLPSVPIETVDEAVIFEVLHDDKTPFSPSFLFQAVRKHYTAPTERRDMDKGDLHYWTQQLRELENKGLGHTQKATECRWWIDKITKGDDEGETIRLLDICADWVKKGDERQQTFTVQTNDGIVIELPAFNPRREFAYLVTKGLLSLSDTDAFFDQALTDVNTQRLDERHHRLTRDEARTHPDVVAMQKRLAVIGWLRRCNTNKTTPSAILTPLIDETKYQLLRREA